MPITPDGAERLAAELERAHDVVDPPRLVWVFDREALRERRATLYGWHGTAPRHALLVSNCPGRVDRVEWVCEPFVRARHE